MKDKDYDEIKILKRTDGSLQKFAIMRETLLYNYL